MHALTAYRRKGKAELLPCDRPEDAKLAERMVYGVLQNERFLDSCISRYVSTVRTHPYVLDLLRLSAYQILYLDRIPDSAAVNDAVMLCRNSGQRYAAGMVNAVLRRLCAEKDELLAADLEPAIRFSHPDWLVERLLENYDSDFVCAFLKSNQTIPSLTLQINTMKTALEPFLRLLGQRGIEPVSIRSDFSSVRIQSTRVDQLPGYSDGLFFVQDDAARASVRMIGLKPGMKVLDVCAAPGGKSMAAALEGADVVSCDVNPLRLKRCTENYTRLRLPISTREIDAERYHAEFENGFDAVIADVPCSGTGVIRRHPEIRRRSYEDVKALLPIQARILDNVSSYVRPGGALLYSTCSVLEEENETQVKAFLQKHPEFHPLSAGIDGFDCSGGMLRSWTQQNGNDGFFAAKMVRQYD